MNNRDTNWWFVVSALAIGGLIGAAVMVLMAPQSGRKTRALLMSKGQEFKGRAIDTSTNTGKKVGAMTQRAVDQATNFFRHGKDMGENIKSNIEEEAKSKSVQFWK